jgi:predicted nucleotidyltransferase
MDISEIKDRIAGYCAEKQEVVACYLFGSRAAGNNRQWSDLDIAFLLDDGVPVSLYNGLRFAIIGELGRLTRLDIHLLIMNNAGELILDQVFRKGVCVYSRNTDALRAFRRHRLPMIAEFNYYVEMMRTKLKQRYGGQAHG